MRLPFDCAHMPMSTHPKANETMNAGSVRRPVLRVREGEARPDMDVIASEMPLALRYNGEAFAVMMATPMDLEDFALGFSLSEAIIDSADEMLGIDVQAPLEGFEIDMRIPKVRSEAIASRQRVLEGRGGCGMCGMRELEQVLRHPSAVVDGVRVSEAALHRGLAALSSAQPLNQLTGATHAAAWFDADGNLLCVREDVGRHNALDKLIGAMAKAKVDRSRGFLILTSRASYEMVQKAATFGIGFVAAISAPTAMAIHFAESSQVTLIGFARGNSRVIYTHAHRIVSNES